MATLISDPAIAEAYEDVRSDKSETAWMVLKYAPTGPDKLALAETGTGDVAEMREHFKDDEAAYGYIRVKLGNDEYSERTKFVFVVWTGSNTKIMRKAKMSFQSGQVKQIIRAYAVEIQTEDKRDLDADAVTMKLRKAMGANYDRQNSAY